MRVAVDSLVATTGVTGSPTGTAVPNGARGTSALLAQSAIDMKTMATIGAATPLSPLLTNLMTPSLMDCARHGLRQGLCGSRMQLVKRRIES